MGYLIYLQLQSEKLPDKPVLPAYFLVIPITCLFGISLFRIAMYMQTYLSINMSGLSFFIINFSYVITISWGTFTLYLLSNYFKNEFISSDFAFTQWGIVWGFVGSQVLGVYVNGFYFNYTLLASLNYISVIIAVTVWLLVLSKFRASLKIQIPQRQIMQDLKG